MQLPPRQLCKMCRVGRRNTGALSICHGELVFAHSSYHCWSHLDSSCVQGFAITCLWMWVITDLIQHHFFIHLHGSSLIRRMNGWEEIISNAVSQVMKRWEKEQGCSSSCDEGDEGEKGTAGRSTFSCNLVAAWKTWLHGNLENSPYNCMF